MLRKVTLTAVFLLLISAGAWAQTEAQLQSFLARISSIENLDQGVAVAASDPETAQAVYQYCRETIGSGGADEQQAQGMVFVMNIIARAMAGLGDSSYVQDLQANNVWVDDQMWASLGGSLNGSQAAPVEQPSGDFADYDRYQYLIRIAASLGNFSRCLAYFREALDKLPAVAAASDSGIVLEFLELAVYAELGLHSTVLEKGPAMLAKVPKLTLVEADDRASMQIIGKLMLANAELSGGQVKPALAYLDEADKLVSGLEGNDRKVARFTLETARFALKLERDPDMPVQTVLAEKDRIWALLDGIPAKDESMSNMVSPGALWLQLLCFRGARALPDEAQTLGDAAAALGPRITAVIDPSEMAEPQLNNPQSIWTFAVGAADFGDKSNTVASTFLEITKICREARKYDAAASWLTYMEEFVPMLDYPGQMVDTALAPLGITDKELTSHGGAQQVQGRFYEEQARLELARLGADPTPAQAGPIKAKLEKAVTFYHQAERPAAMLKLYPQILWLSYLMGEGDPVPKLNEHYDTVKSFGDRELEMEYLVVRGKVLAAKGDKQGAIRDFQAATDLLEELITNLNPTAAGANRLREERSDVYDHLARLQIEQGNPQQALLTIDAAQQLQTVANFASRVRGKDAATEKTLTEAREAQTRSKSLQMELQTMQALPADQQRPEQIARTQRLLADSKATFLQKVRELRTANPEYSRVLSVNPIEFGRLQKSIPPEMAVVQYFPTDKRLYIFVVTADAFRLREVNIGDKEITELVKSFRRQTAAKDSKANFGWSSPEAAPLVSTLTQLHSALIDPIEQDLTSSTVIGFIPSGELHYMPLQALARKKADGSPEFLIERKQVVSLSKATDLVSMASRAKVANPQLVAFGNPDGTLPGAGEESREIAALFNSTAIFTEAKATEKQLIASTPGAAYLHLATHGNLSNRDPNSSYLVMAGDEKLTPPDIFGLPLENTRLVTLSACETALGGPNPGADITSLAEAFWAAGPPTVVASLWRVSDESTRELMLEAYTRLKKGESPAAAFQAAQLKLLHSPKYAHPFYWAPFMVYGDWR